MSLKSIIIIMVLLAFYSCKKTELIIPSEFQPYFDEFISQGNQRGHDFGEIDLTIELATIEDDDIAAYCNQKNNKIVVDKIYWDSHDDEHREWLIFHELGHCLLDRKHRNKTSENWECLSFMKGGKQDEFDCSLNLYSTEWRTYYLDELFNVCSTLPDWYFQNQNYPADENEREYYLNLEMVNLNGFLDTLVIDAETNFVLEVDFINWMDKSDIVGIFFDNIGFSYCHICTSKSISINKNNKEVYRNLIDFSTADLKMTIKKENDFYQFYLNETFIHTFEFSEIDNKIFRTNSFDENIDMNIKFFTIP